MRSGRGGATIRRSFVLPVLLLSVACSGAAGLRLRPEPAHGRLFIAGGGPLPSEFYRHFVELAGGAGRSRIVVFPMASEYEDAGVELAGDFEKLGARSERISLTREAADSEETAARLSNVTGIWFGGGDQSRLTAALKGTRMERAIQERYRAGAVVGGTSAGAAVISRLMITGDERRPGGTRPPPQESQSAFLTIDRDNIITKEGFGFLSNVIVDQHFVRRRRHNRLISLVLEHPELIGVGIDEATAVELGPDGWCTVRGESVVILYDARRARVAAAGTPLGGSGLTMHVLTAGSRFRPDTGEVQLNGAAKRPVPARR